MYQYTSSPESAGQPVTPQTVKIEDILDCEFERMMDVGWGKSITQAPVTIEGENCSRVEEIVVDKDDIEIRIKNEIDSIEKQLNSHGGIQNIGNNSNSHNNNDSHDHTQHKSTDSYSNSHKNKNKNKNTGASTSTRTNSNNIHSHSHNHQHSHQHSHSHNRNHSPRPSPSHFQARNNNIDAIDTSEQNDASFLQLQVNEGESRGEDEEHFENSHSSNQLKRQRISQEPINIDQEDTFNEELAKLERELSNIPNDNGAQLQKDQIENELQTPFIILRHNYLSLCSKYNELLIKFRESEAEKVRLVVEREQMKGVMVGLSSEVGMWRQRERIRGFENSNSKQTVGERFKDNR
ncbi:hypothetical protein DAMA08_015800 [Martiniozyma asiatica (nom. inval.)]|nr:hypothetical protein DAMA08_015800 [Martiniozyma asiatica]